MDQMFALVYKTGPQKGEVYSYATVLADPFPDALYERMPVDHSPGLDEVWNKAQKKVVSVAVPPLSRKEELTAKPAWTDDERDEYLRLLG